MKILWPKISVNSSETGILLPYGRHGLRLLEKVAQPACSQHALIKDKSVSLKVERSLLGRDL